MSMFTAGEDVNDKEIGYDQKKKWTILFRESFLLFKLENRDVSVHPPPYSVLYKWPLQTGLYVGSFLKRAGGFN